MDCQRLIEFNITDPNEISLNINAEGIVCNGESNGMAELIISDGNAPYQIEWFQEFVLGPFEDTSINNNAQVENLSPGNYSVNVTDVDGVLSNQILLLMMLLQL